MILLQILHKHKIYELLLFTFEIDFCLIVSSRLLLVFNLITLLKLLLSDIVVVNPKYCIT